MTGRHRGTSDNSVAAGLEAISLMALLALGIYAAVAYPATDPFIVIGSLSIVFISAAGRFASRALRKWPRSLEGRADLIEQLVFVAIFAVVLVNVLGQQLKWGDGAFHIAAIAIGAAAVVAMPVYWLGGRRRLIAALAARAATRDSPPSPTDGKGY